MSRPATAHCRRGADVCPGIPAAGAAGRRGSAGAALQELLQEGRRPSTAQRPSSARLSAAWGRDARRGDVGCAGRHPGAAFDTPAPDIRFGHRNRFEPGVQAALQMYPESRFVQLIQEQRERVYKSSREEPIGRSRVRGLDPPPLARDNPDFRHGVRSVRGV
eukprot:TRINITY_DN30599_c0_g1_i1.p4 TRINITY_DN30599_c0_g1~~TRINITY_DN30599_c0_g1_i1.p4  ORF type:complete len:162 (+),score=48.95 TRINITY_DN30599_c0_g1_i1:58-543(+)